MLRECKRAQKGNFMDFNRKNFKKAALAQLEGRWTPAVLFGLFFLVIYFLCFVPVFVSMIGLGGGNIENASKDYLITHFITFYLITLAIISIILPILITAYVYSICEFQKTSEKIRFSVFFKGLSHWAKGLGTFWYNVFRIFLWYLLLGIIGFVAIVLIKKPGLIIWEIVSTIFIIRKLLQYSLSLYLLVENPQIKVTETLANSFDYTENHLMDLFMLHLSFLGWYLLSVITAGIGLLWLAPYYVLTNYNAALFLKAETEEALKPGKNNPEPSQAETIKSEDNKNE